jgi:hypothetical protein
MIDAGPAPIGAAEQPALDFELGGIGQRQKELVVEPEGQSSSRRDFSGSGGLKDSISSASSLLGTVMITASAVTVPSAMSTSSRRAL